MRSPRRRPCRWRPSVSSTADLCTTPRAISALPTSDDCIASRLALVPKLRQRASPGLLGQAPLTWVDDPDFDIAEHVRVRQLAPPATEAELRRLCADLMAVPLERTRPLWDLTFVEGLDDGRVALIERLHHSMADGLAAAELATVLLDLSPESSPLGETVPPWSPSPRPPAWLAAAGDLLRLASVTGSSSEVVRGDDRAPDSAHSGVDGPRSRDSAPS